MLYYSTDALYRQIISELPFSDAHFPSTFTDRPTLLLRAFTSGFVAGWHRALLPEHWLEQQLRFVAYSALQQDGDLADPTVYQWCLAQLTAAWNPATDAGRVLQHAGARTPFDAQHSASPTEPLPGLPFAEALVTGLNTLRSTWRLLQILDLHR